MMKKFMALMISMMLVLSLTACGDTEETTSDAASVESVAEDVAESVEEEIASEEEADTVSSLWDLANAETPDLAGTTWSLVGGCLDGVEMEQEDLDATLEMYGGKLELAFAEDGTVQMVNVNDQNSVNKLIDMIPSIASKIKSFGGSDDEETEDSVEIIE